MNNIKRSLGIVWMILSIVLVIFMIYEAYLKVVAATPGVTRTNTFLQWIIILLVFIPICTGLFIFGRYAMNREYDV
ncbi:MAG: DUF6814 family protein [Saprospiraceae bacterium]